MALFPIRAFGRSFSKTQVYDGVHKATVLTLVGCAGILSIHTAYLGFDVVTRHMEVHRHLIPELSSLVRNDDRLFQ